MLTIFRDKPIANKLAYIPNNDTQKIAKVVETGIDIILSLIEEYLHTIHDFPVWFRTGY